MSLQWMGHAWKSGPPTYMDRYVFLCLADNANDEGFCYPSLQTISIKTLLSLPSVKRCIRRLIADGWVERLATGSGAGYRSEYRLRSAPGVDSEKGVSQTPFRSRSKKGVSQTPIRDKKRGLIDPHKGVSQIPIKGSNGSSPTPPIRKNRHLTVRGNRSGLAATAGARALPSQAPASPAKSAMHRNPAPKAAMRRRPPGASRVAQAVLPLRPEKLADGHHVSGAGRSYPRAGQHSVFPAKDSRFDPLANEIRNIFWLHVTKGTPAEDSVCPWTTKAKAATSRLLAQNPKATLEDFKRMLRNRYESALAGEYPRCEGPEKWIGGLMAFYVGKLNRFGDQIRTSKEDKAMEARQARALVGSR